jgi:hypothetical protein
MAEKLCNKNEVNVTLPISVHMATVTKQTQLMHSSLFIFYVSSPRHVSAGNYTIIKAAMSKIT